MRGDAGRLNLYLQQSRKIYPNWAPVEERELRDPADTFLSLTSRHYGGILKLVRGMALESIDFKRTPITGVYLIMFNFLFESFFISP